MLSGQETAVLKAELIRERTGRTTLRDTSLSLPHFVVQLDDSIVRELAHLGTQIKAQLRFLLELTLSSSQVPSERSVDSYAPLSRHQLSLILGTQPRNPQIPLCTLVRFQSMP